MKRTYLPMVLFAAVGYMAAGCGCGGPAADDGVKSSLTNSESDDHAIAVRVGGDWKKLTQVEKDKFTKEYGSVSTAKDMLNHMAHPPNLKNMKKPN